MVADSIEKVVNLCARRALVFPSAEPYAALGGFAGFFDYAHYGALLKKRVRDEWWKRFVSRRGDVIALDGALLTPRAVWEASGHLTSFNDPLVECVKCKARYRADALVEAELKASVDGVSLEKLSEMLLEHKIVCLKCGGELGEVKTFSLMFKTSVGADEKSDGFLQPETAQSIFVDFPRLALASRKKLPFGIAQIGRVFRNEIAPRNFVFRAREFELMEIEFFVHPARINDCEIPEALLDLKVQALTAAVREKKQLKQSASAKKTSFRELVEKKVIGCRWLGYWIAEFMQWFYELGISRDRLRIRQHSRDELSHYSRETWDVEYAYPQLGWKELMGVAYRGDFDLRAHAARTGKDFSLYDDEAKQKIFPHVVEPSLGVDRLVLTLLVDAYNEKKIGGETRTVLSLSPRIAPLQVCVFPLVSKDGLPEKAREVFKALHHEFVCEFDESGSIGRRYARADEVGCPACVTVDYDSLKDDSVTVRDRDSAKQERVKISKLANALKRLVTTA